MRGKVPLPQAAQAACEKQQNGDDAYQMPSDDEGGALAENSLITMEKDESMKKRRRKGEFSQEPAGLVSGPHASPSSRSAGDALASEINEYISPIVAWLMNVGGVPGPDASFDQMNDAPPFSSGPCQCCSSVKPLVYKLLKKVDAERERQLLRDRQCEEAQEQCRSASRALAAREGLRATQEEAIQGLKSQLDEMEERMRKKKQRQKLAVRQLEERIEVMTKERESLGQALMKQSEELSKKEKEIEALMRENKETMMLIRREGKYVDKCA
jgi:hypothetical protein